MQQNPSNFSAHERQKSILVVDDSATIRSGLSRELERHGFFVQQAAGGREAYDAARSRHFDLIITDIDMPEMDGFSLCAKLKQDSPTQSTPVIILSGSESETDIEQGFRAGAAAFLSKATARTDLHQKITEVFQKACFIRERRILVVDDSELILTIARQGLVRAGFNVITAADGAQALELLRSQNPDLVISDVNMPKMDGFALCSAMRADPDLASTPFVVMSTAGERAVIRRMLERGACAYLEKPFNVEQLVVTVEKLLSDHFQLILKEKERLDTERNAMIGTIASLVQALEARDRYTRGHSETVAEISMGIAAQMGFSDEDIQNIHRAAKLHDIGKIGIRDSILLKEGPLSQDEFDLIKQHPVIGAEILGPVGSMAEIIPGVLHHHERTDGTGYPKGLAGNDIPLQARIIAVADTFDSLTSDRPYHKKVPRSKALEILQEATPDQLCPECVQVFLSWIQGRASGFTAA